MLLLSETTAPASKATGVENLGQFSNFIAHPFRKICGVMCEMSEFFKFSLGPNLCYTFSGAPVRMAGEDWYLASLMVKKDRDKNIARGPPDHRRSAYNKKTLSRTKPFQSTCVVLNNIKLIYSCWWTVASPGFVARRGKDGNYLMGHSS